MLSMKLLLTFGLLTGIFVEQCDLGDFDVAMVSSKITVTNLSEEADAFVGVQSNHGQVNYGIAAGTSRTITALMSTRYIVKVVGHTSGDVDLDAYRNQLLTLRSQMQDLTLGGTASASVLATAVNELTLVQTALEQMNGSKTVQSCGGTLVEGGTSQVTVKWNATLEDVGFWVLDCG